MRRVLTSDLLPGMRAAEDIYSFNNQMIIPKNTELDDKMITRLEFYSILAVRIFDEDENVPTFGKIDSSSSYSQRLKSSLQFKNFEQSYLRTTEFFSQSLNLIANEEGEINTSSLMSNVTNLLSKCDNSISVMDMLHNMNQYDDLTYIHSINVAIIANVFASWLHLGSEDREILTMGGLLHDIGKLKVSDKIISKPGKLTDSEYEMVKTHALHGYKILKNQKLDPRIKECALMHHERCDGSGYPMGLKSDDISPYAKIIAIADVYDAMTSARVYRGPLCPVYVISVFEDEGFQKYDTRYLLPFLEHIATTYMNNRVRLSNGMEGEIVYLNPHRYSRPMIKTGNTFIDLTKSPDIYIEELL